MLLLCVKGGRVLIKWTIRGLKNPTRLYPRCCLAGRFCWYQDLCPNREILLGDELQVIENDGLPCFFGIVGTEHQNTLATEEETI